MTRVLILPGLFGSDIGHWQHHWLDDQPDSALVAQHDWDQPSLADWMTKLESALEEAGEAYLVAHSLGCLLAANLTDRPAARRVRGALLVAPCDLSTTESLHPGRISFGTMPTGRLPFPSILVGSLNDVYMAIDRLHLFGRLWQSEVQNIGLAGHINVASGFGRWAGGYARVHKLKIWSRSHHVPSPPDCLLHRSDRKCSNPEAYGRNYPAIP
ncbi:RBBP9/YdeN family alpha/beta hydrolase [Rhizobium rhizogenes]|uniref:RBBP9/YdeN family alpha/beta hydrolase n=1 Tax=Rhizobium rhizogenes TaxID=359 RepID=UPI001572299E|nr:alpha/beta fold hydrolase [Rhizobium rhizogenes]NTI78684.1 serine hydrolase family protein [Rhizobium rhizogenes]